MKIERRGKYPGIKVHLDDQECQELLNASQVPDTFSSKAAEFRSQFVLKLSGKIRRAIEEDPTILVERTPEQVREVLESELQTAQQKLQAISKGTDWTGFTKGALKEQKKP